MDVLLLSISFFLLNLRWISSLEIFSTNRLNLFLRIREEEIKCLLCKLCGDSLEDRFRVVELEPMLRDLMFNIVMRMVAGKKFYERRDKFREMVTQIMAHSGGFIPLWRFIDPSGFEKRVKKLGKTSDELVQELVDEIRDKNDGGNTMIHPRRIPSLNITTIKLSKD
ncbi:Cytochrome P450 81F2, partial [Cucurbita argyrosperma subsp. argyrosperma]